MLAMASVQPTSALNPALALRVTETERKRLYFLLLLAFHWHPSEKEINKQSYKKKAQNHGRCVDPLFCADGF